MEKEFNVTGTCYPDLHYMADTSVKVKSVMHLIEQGKYLAINRPRQYGKTTTMNLLLESLLKTSDYLPFFISFEGVGDAVFADEKGFCTMFLELLARESKSLGYTDLVELILETKQNTASFQDLSAAITDMATRNDKKWVLFIDEVDKSSNNQLFLSFLGILRDVYLRRNRSTHKTFHSVVLAGVYDVKSLKLKLRPDDERKYNSPWNIAADFKVDMNLQPDEIVPMLEEYAKDRNVDLDAQSVAKRLFYYTSGYPFLVTKLCKIFDEEQLAQKTDRSWTTHDVDKAAYQLVREDNTNFRELIKNLENNQPLYKLAQSVVINEQEFPYDLHEPSINLGSIFGIFANRNGLAIHNRIYHEVIANYMTVSLLVQSNQLPIGEYGGIYLLPGNRLDVKKALYKFQELMRVEYSKKDRDFLERQSRLVFLAFLKPILNGHGHAFKEPQISEERRLDVLITYYEHQYVIELKIWRGSEAHHRGLDQLADYLDRLGLEEGGLLIFDNNSVKDWKKEEIVHRGKRIVAVWV